MSLPTTIEFTHALHYFADVLAAKLGLPAEQVTAALATHEGQESLEEVYRAWLEHDDTLDFDDDVPEHIGWEPSESETPPDSDDYDGPGYDDIEDEEQW